MVTSLDMLTGHNEDTVCFLLNQLFLLFGIPYLRYLIPLALLCPLYDELRCFV
jgi:hypothetical protein